MEVRPPLLSAPRVADGSCAPDLPVVSGSKICLERTKIPRYSAFELRHGRSKQCQTLARPIPQGMARRRKVVALHADNMRKASASSQERVESR